MTTQSRVLPVLGALSPRSRGLQACAPGRGCRGGDFLVSSASAGPRCPVAWGSGQSLCSLPEPSCHLDFGLSVLNPPCLPVLRTLLRHLGPHLGPHWPNQDDLLISGPLTQAHLCRPFFQIRSQCRFWGLGLGTVFGNHSASHSQMDLGSPLVLSPCSCLPRGRPDLICAVAAGRRHGQSVHPGVDGPGMGPWLPRCLTRRRWTRISKNALNLNSDLHVTRHTPPTGRAHGLSSEVLGSKGA